MLVPSVPVSNMNARHPETHWPGDPARSMARAAAVGPFFLGMKSFNILCAGDFHVFMSWLMISCLIGDEVLMLPPKTWILTHY